MPSIAPEKRPPSRNSLLTLVIAILLLSGVFLIFNSSPSKIKKIPLNQFTEEAANGVIGKIKMETATNRIDIIKIDNSKQYTYKDPASSIEDLLKDVPKSVKKNIDIEIIPKNNDSFWLNLLISVLPFLLLIGFIMYTMRQAQSSNNQAMSFGKSRAKLFDGNKKKTMFTDVAGALEAKEELIEVVDFLKTPTKYTQIGAKIPKGVLLIGAPGTGKTLLARAVAGEANVPFFSISGSEFVEMFVGVGASRVRDLFKKAQKNAPCIIFIDEIDAVGRQRGAGLGGGHDEREQTLNQILTEMDGFEGDTGIIVMAATNRPDVLDPALLRPGRFDRRIMVDLPDIKDREEILKVHTRNKPLEKNVDLKIIAQHTPGFSGADLENIMNEAAILAARENRKTITQDDLQLSVEKVMMGPERKSRGLSEKEKIRTAYHELGHALVGQLRTNCDPVHKVSIVSRGMALGVTWFLPEEDKHLYTRSKFFDEICSLLGGYSSEIEFFKEMSTGASNDLERAYKMANRMVTVYGMSALGPISLGEQHQEVFLGRDFGHVKNYSEATARLIDEESRKIINQALEISKKLIHENHDRIDKMSKTLIKQENLNKEEFLSYFTEKESKKSHDEDIKLQRHKKKSSKKD